MGSAGLRGDAQPAVPLCRRPDDVVGGASLYPAVQNLLTAARAEGLGGVLTTLISRSEPAVQELLGMPAEWGVHAMVPLGYPRGKHGPLTRLPLDQMVHHDRWRD